MSVSQQAVSSPSVAGEGISISDRPLNVAVVVASLGRPQNVTALLGQLSKQTLLPSVVILSMESEADAPAPASYPFPIQSIFGPRGSSVQRNRGLDALPEETDVVVFYDDDFVPSAFSLEGLSRLFAAHPHISGAKGKLIADGIRGVGIPPDEARRMVGAHDEKGDAKAVDILAEHSALYGCNMSYRVAHIAGLRFDEDLPLYGWLEDLDFGGQIKKGPLVSTNAFTGVHCGEKSGREKSGKRLGYSQVCNPIHLWRKGTLPANTARKMIVRTVISNHFKMFTPEPWIDRKGRALGNWIAICDLVLRKAHPTRILDF